MCRFCWLLTRVAPYKEIRTFKNLKLILTPYLQFIYHKLTHIFHCFHSLNSHRPCSQQASYSWWGAAALNLRNFSGVKYYSNMRSRFHSVSTALPSAHPPRLSGSFWHLVCHWGISQTEALWHFLAYSVSDKMYYLDSSNIFFPLFLCVS